MSSIQQQFLFKKVSFLKVKSIIFILTAFFVLGNKTSYAQSTGSITGNVISDNQPIEYATVSLAKHPDSTKVLFHTITDSLGRFSFDKISFGIYRLHISLIGHQSISQEINVTSENSTITLKNLELLISTKELATVNITARKKIIQKTTEGFIVNTATNITQTGGTATDLLRSIPTVSVDAEGGITLRGKQPLILVNGRNSAFTSIDQIPASNIESIEIINNASAKYDANAQSGIINIKLKKNKTSGTNGAVSLGAGFGSRARTANSLLINHKTSKWNLGLSYDNRFAGRTKHITLDRTNYFLPNDYYLNQDRNDERVERLQSLKFNTDFMPNAKNTFTFEAFGNAEGQDNDETLLSVVNKNDKSFNSSNNRHSLEYRRFKLGEFALGYNKKFDNPKQSFSVNLTTSLQQGRENTDISTQNLNQNQGNIGNPFYQRTHNYQDGNISNIIIDYSFPLTKKSIVETGYKGTFRNSKNNYEAADKVGNDFIVNTASTNTFKFNEKINAVYALYHSFIGTEENAKWRYDIGLRFEQVNNNGNTQNNATKFTNEYGKLFPSVILSYAIKDNQALKFSYAKRINRPELDDLNPFVDITDALNPHSGNPNLQPEIIQAIELGYNKEWKDFTLSSSLFYRNAQNTIRTYFQTQSNGTVLRLPVNIGSADNYGIENIITAKPAKFYDINASFTLFQQNFNGNNVSADATQNGFNWYGKLINNFSIGSKGKLQIIGNYNSALTTPQGKLTPVYNLDLGYQQKLGKKGNTRLGLIVVDMFDNLQSGNKNYTTNFYSYRTQKADTRAVMLTFVYSFKSAFKEHLMENKFSKEF